MGRTLLVDKRVQKIVDSLVSADTWTIGLVIGQRAEAKDYVVHLVKTPVIDEAGHDSAKTTQFGNIDDQWVSVHCKQMLRMLPGGLDVIGVFAIAHSEPLRVAQDKLRQILFAVHKETVKWQSQTVVVDDVPDKILIQICSLTRKLTCRTYDVTDNKAGAKPADWKVQNTPEPWIQLDSTMAFNVEFAIPHESMSSTLMKQIQTGLSPSFENVRNAVATVNNNLITSQSSMEAFLSSNPGKKKGKKHHGMTAEGKQTLQVQLFTSLMSNSNIAPPTVEECGARMLLKGSLCGRAFVNAKATADKTLKAIKQDILRSIQSRIEMLCEDLLQAEEEQDEHILYEMPVRVFCSLSESTLCFCDYMLQDEGIDDSLERFRDISGLTDASDESLETQVERVPTEEELYESPNRLESENLLDSKYSTSSSIVKQAKGFIGLVGGGAVAALAVGISYMYLGQE